MVSIADKLPATHAIQAPTLELRSQMRLKQICSNQQRIEVPLGNTFKNLVWTDRVGSAHADMQMHPLPGPGMYRE